MKQPHNAEEAADFSKLGKDNTDGQAVEQKLAVTGTGSHSSGDLTDSYVNQEPWLSSQEGFSIQRRSFVCVLTVKTA